MPVLLLVGECNSKEVVVNPISIIFPTPLLLPINVVLPLGQGGGDPMTSLNISTLLSHELRPLLVHTCGHGKVS